MSDRRPKSEQIPIPKEWRTVVCRILHDRGAKGRKNIIITSRASSDWSLAFPGGFPWDLPAALEDVLKDDSILGRRVPDIRPPGEAYEFMFTHLGKLMYGKANLLTPARKVVVVISAHIPNKGDKL